MPTLRQRLQATITELQNELSEESVLDPATRLRLQATLNDILAALNRQNDPATTSDPQSADADQDGSSMQLAPQSFAARLGDATRGLESSHPELSTALGSVISALAQMGI